LLDSGQAQNPRRERNPLSVDGADLSTNVPILRMNGEKYLIVNADDFGQSPGSIAASSKPMSMGSSPAQA
jgi:hypothetical protein